MSPLIKKAYAVLGDAEKRREYDMQSQGLRFGGGGGSNGGAFTFNFGDLFGQNRGGRAEKRNGGGFGGIFEQMFGGGGGGGIKFNSNFGAGL